MKVRLFGMFALVAMTGISALGAPLKSRVEMTVTFEGRDRTVVFELDDLHAPKTCANFRKLCQEGFYDGILFHRVIPGYIVQAGDPFSKEPARKGEWGMGGPGYTVAPELGKFHLKGSIAMARLGDAKNPKKESSGSQFYISLDRIASLDGEYTVFGEVISGLDVLEEIGKTPADRTNVPLDRIVIKSTSVLGDSVTPPPIVTTPPPAKVDPVEPAPLPIPQVKQVKAPAPPVQPAPKPMAEESIRDITPPTASNAPVPTNSGQLPEREQKTKIPKSAKKEGGFAKFIKRFW